MRSEDKQFIEGHTMDSQEPVSQDSLARTLHFSPFLVEEAGFFQVAFVCLVVTVNDTDAYLLGLETQVCRRGEENFLKKNGHASWEVFSPVSFPQRCNSLLVSQHPPKLLSRFYLCKIRSKLKVACMGKHYLGA